MKYEFTITLRPRMFTLTPQQQYDRTSPMLWFLFKDYEVSCVAELTQENNIHYHCIIELAGAKQRDTLLTAFRSYANTFGRKSLNQVQFEESYITYMRKDVIKTKEIIKDCIVRDFYGIFRTIF